MNDNNNILITGVTGQLGSQLLRLILKKYLYSDNEIFVLVRGENYNQARRKVESVLKFLFKEKYTIKLLNRLIILLGEISQRKLSLNKNIYAKLLNRVHIIYHSAALANFQASLEDVRRMNVEGSKNIIRFSQDCINLRKFNYISTAFIAGTYQGVFSESNLDVAQRFNNPYERSKFEVEKYLKKFSNNYTFEVNIFRPSIIVGEYKQGLTLNFQMFYQPLKLLSLGLFSLMPVDKKTRLNLIPVDVAAKAIFVLASIKQPRNYNVFHIVAPKAIKITHLIVLASRYFGFLPPKLVSRKTFSSKEKSSAKTKLLQPYVPYFNFQATYDSRATLTALNQVKFCYPEFDDNFLLRLFKYAEKSNFIKRK